MYDGILGNSILVCVLFDGSTHPYIPLHFVEMIFPLVPLIFFSGSVSNLQSTQIRLCAKEVYNCTWYKRIMCGHEMITMRFGVGIQFSKFGLEGRI